MVIILLLKDSKDLLSSLGDGEPFSIIILKKKRLIL